MTTQTTPRARIRHRTALAVGLLAISLLTVSLFVAAAPSPRFETTADDTWYEGEGEATMGLHGVSNDELAIEAFFPRESYRPGTTATLRFESTLERVRLKVFHAGPEWGKTVGDNEMRGLPATDPVLLDRISSGGSTRDPDRQLGDRPLLRPAHGQGRPGRVCTVRRPAEAARPESGRRGAADPHLAGVQLPRRRRRRHRGHLVRKRGRPGHRRPAPAVPESWRPAALPWVRPPVPPLAEPHRQAGRLSLQAELDAVPELRRCAAPTTCSTSPGTTST